VGKKPDGVPYVDYYISMHLSYCRGPVDQWTGLEIKDKELFEDDERYFNNVTLSVNKPDLFGGNLREGGLVGDIYFMNGGAAQKSPQALAKRVDSDPDDMPGYRGVVSLFLCGNDNTGAKGFKVGSNMPNVPPIYGRFRRGSRQLDNNVQVIPTPNGNWHNSNPANLIFECLVHKDLMHGPRAQINEASFNEAAQTLFDEEFGISLLWSGQNSIESFVQEVLDHINALLFFNPYTGKLNLKLLRDDYDPASLPELGPDTCRVKTFRRPLWGETINEIVLTYTDPRNEEQVSVTYQDLGNIAMQGAVVSETREMPGIRDRQLANRTCARELRQASAPLASATIEMNRQNRKPDGSPYLPGDVFRLVYPLHNIAGVIFRVLEIDWGTVDDAKITMKCVEDIFGLPYAMWEEPDDTSWEPPEKDPNDDLFDMVGYLFRATPLSIINRRAPTGITGFEITDDLYNQIAINTYVMPTDAQTDLNYYIPYRPSVDTLGEEIWAPLGEKTVVGHTVLVGNIDQAVRSEIVVEETIGPGDWPKKGYLGMFIGADEFSDELFTFEERLAPNTWRIRRGVLDTVPAKWNSGAKIIIHANNYNGFDWSPRFADTEERYRFQIRTSLGLSDLSNEVTTVRPDRPYRPYRPANVRIEAVRFGTEDQSQMLNPPVFDIYDMEHVPRDWEIDCTWSRRNRWAEDQTWLAWSDPDVPPEDGQTTEIILLRGSEEINRFTGLTGTSFTLNIIETTAQMLDMKLRFISRRDGFESLQGVEIALKLYIKGYGSDWGYLWGGWPEDPFLTGIESDMTGLLPGTKGLVWPD